MQITRTMPHGLPVALVVGLLGVAMSLAACTNVSKSGITYTQLPDRGLSAVLPGDLATVHAHAVHVLKDQFHYTITRDRDDALEGVVEARTAKDQTITVETYKQTDRSTKVVVHAGFFESADKGEQILDAIQASLPGPARK